MVKKAGLGHIHAVQQVSHDLQILPSFLANLETGGASPSSPADENKPRETLKLDEEKLIQALATRIQVPIYGTDTLRRYLEDAEWVQGLAYETFMADYNALGATSASPENLVDNPEPKEGLPQRIRGVPVIHHHNQEERRREALRMLQTIINIERDPNNKINLTVTEAFFSLVLAGWDVENAVDRWASEAVTRWQLHYNFDHLRPSTTDQAGIDERIARFVHFTGRDDWHSVRSFLKAHNQCFMQAVRAWYHHGMPAIRTQGWNAPARLFTGRRVTYEGVPRSGMPSDNEVIPTQVSGDVWAPNETSFRPAGQPPNDPAARPLEDLRTNNKRNRGFCFTPEGHAPVIGGVMPQHFTVDYLQNGKYRANGFSWENWFRPELPESSSNKSTNPRFNEFDQRHIALLGRWIRQQYSRCEGTKKRLRPQDFSKQEKKYLFELCKRHLQKLLEDNPEKTKDDFRPLEFRAGATEKLEKDFNEAFEGTKQGTSDEPRRHRKGTALKVKLARMKKFRVAFGFKNSSKDDDDESSAWSDDDTAPAGQPSRVPLTIPSMHTAAEEVAEAVRQFNRHEEGANDTIDADADGLLDRLRATAQEAFHDDEQVKARICELLQEGLVDEETTLNARAVIRHVMRRLAMPIHGEAPADHAPSSQADAEVPPVETSKQRGLLRIQHNMTEESSMPDIDTLAVSHRRQIRAQAEDHWVENGILFPSEEQIGLQMRIILQNECVNGKHSVQHAAVIRRLMRSMNMVIPEELEEYGDDSNEGMVEDENTVGDTIDVGSEAEAGSAEEDMEISDIDELEFEVEYFDQDVLESDDE
jgi:hypothetical protein